MREQALSMVAAASRNTGATCAAATRITGWGMVAPPSPLRFENKAVQQYNLSFQCSFGPGGPFRSVVHATTPHGSRAQRQGRSGQRGAYDIAERHAGRRAPAMPWMLFAHPYAPR